MDEAAIGRTLRERRKALRLTQQDVAVLVGVHRETVIAVENAGQRRGVTLTTLISIAGVLGLDVLLGARSD